MYARPPIEEYPQIRSFVVSRCFYFKNFFFAFCENPSTAYFYCTVVIIASTIRAFIDCDDVHVSFADWAGGIVFEFEVTAPRVLARLASVRIRRPMHDNYPFPVRHLFLFFHRTCSFYNHTDCRRSAGLYGNALPTAEVRRKSIGPVEFQIRLEIESFRRKRYPRRGFRQSRAINNRKQFYR